MARQNIGRKVSEDLGISLILLRTNMRGLNKNMQFWMYKQHGSFLAGHAHLLGKSHGIFYIASTYNAEQLQPWGSHPMLDPFFGSQQMRIVHHGLEYSRLQKISALIEWDLALELMNVCVSAESSGMNCGRCEKCVRTKLHLYVTGSLAASKAFKEDDVTTEELEQVNIGSDYARSCYAGVLDPLETMGRKDLANAIRKAIRTYDFRQTLFYSNYAAIRSRILTIARRILHRL